MFNRTKLNVACYVPHDNERYLNVHKKTLQVACYMLYATCYMICVTNYHYKNQWCGGKPG